MEDNKNLKWTVKKPDGAVYDPADIETIKRWIQEKRVLPEDHISPEGWEEWRQVRSLPQFADLFDLKSNKTGHEKGTNRNFINTNKLKFAEKFKKINREVDEKTTKFFNKVTPWNLLCVVVFLLFGLIGGWVGLLYGVACFAFLVLLIRAILFIIRDLVLFIKNTKE